MKIESQSVFFKPKLKLNNFLLNRLPAERVLRRQVVGDDGEEGGARNFVPVARSQLLRLGGAPPRVARLLHLTRPPGTGPGVVSD